MTHYASFFAGKKIAQLGLGLLGRGVGDAAFLARHGAHLTVTDMKNAEDLRTSLDALKDYGNISYTLGRHDFADFENVDFVVKGAGVRLDNPYILHAQKNGIPVYMSTALFAHLSGLKTIGVTGTRGKTTTTLMIAAILERAGEKVLRGGNLRGVSTLAQLPEAAACDVAVLELDSWQMQGFDGLGISPSVSVFTNFYPDHMNYYDGDMKRYFRDKAAIFRHQKPGDVLVTTAEILSRAAQEGETIPAHVSVAAPLPADFGLQLPGAHNLANAGLAKAAAKALGLDEASIDAALRAFTAVEGRLQPVGDWQKRRFYNDSNATTQEATLAALTSFDADKTVLIFGGADKGLPLDRLIAHIRDNKIRAVLLAGTGSDRVVRELPELKPVGSMREAVEKAAALSREGDAIILSPAFASFGLFKNEYDRSDQYLREAAALSKNG